MRKDCINISFTSNELFDQSAVVWNVDVISLRQSVAGSVNGDQRECLFRKTRNDALPPITVALPSMKEQQFSRPISPTISLYFFASVLDRKLFGRVEKFKVMWFYRTTNRAAEKHESGFAGALRRNPSY